MGYWLFICIHIYSYLFTIFVVVALLYSFKLTYCNKVATALVPPTTPTRTLSEATIEKTSVKAPGSILKQNFFEGAQMHSEGAQKHLKAGYCLTSPSEAIRKFV